MFPIRSAKEGVAIWLGSALVSAWFQKCAHAIRFIAEMAHCKFEFWEDINYLAHCSVGEVIH